MIVAPNRETRWEASYYTSSQAQPFQTSCYRCVSNEYAAQEFLWARLQTCNLPSPCKA